VRDAVDSIGDGAEKAAKAVVAPVADLATDAAHKIQRELTEMWRGLFGSPIPPGTTNWNAYSHDELYNMLHVNADVDHAGQQSSVLDGLGRSAHDCAEEVDRQHRTVSEFWRGKASGAFGVVLGEHRTGGAALAEHTSALATAVTHASEALSRAQRQMPAPVDAGEATQRGAVAGGVSGGLAGGLPGAALGAATGAGSSWFGSSLLAANKKAEAVEVMQRYEQSLRSAEPPQAPEKLPPGTRIVVQNPEQRPVVRSGSEPAARTPRPGDPVPTGGPTDTRFGDPRSSSASSGGGVAGGPAADTILSRTDMSGAATLPPGNSTASASAGLATGQDGRASGHPVGWRDLVGNARPGQVSGVDGGPGAGQNPAVAGSARGAAQAGRTAPGLPGVGAPGAGSRRTEDEEHRNRMPRNSKLFVLDEKPSPPVIGA
jgi:uncharacterized protein YukE